MERDRNIAMGLGSNTYAAATLTRSVKMALSHIKYSSIRNRWNSDRTQWHKDWSISIASSKWWYVCMSCLMMRDIYTHIDAVLVVVVVLMKIYLLFLFLFLGYLPKSKASSIKVLLWRNRISENIFIYPKSFFHSNIKHTFIICSQYIQYHV